jgi:hypothetical protein
VSSHDNPVFDALRGGSSPCADFGPRLEGESVLQNFETVASEAKSRVASIFGVEVDYGDCAAEALEGIVREMWETGWDPTKGSIDLFSTDLGCLLTKSVQQQLGGEVVFRSSRDLSHASIWFPHQRVEVFPFHRVFKRLKSQDGESLVYFLRSVSAMLAEAPNHADHDPVPGPRQV